ncbi:MAG: hypothetical protein HDR04_13465 [Lachnospiraceae bacterium]|nr:hypothetical protein [Lachnospiraceae bacterium]
MSALKDIMNGDVLKKAKEYFTKIKYKFFKSKDIPQIEIHSWNDHPAQAAPRIRIGNVNNRHNETRTEPEMTGENIGHGITVKKQGKPKRCPCCASPARDENNIDIIVPNSSGVRKWFCKNCESIF